MGQIEEVPLEATAPEEILEEPKVIEDDDKPSNIPLSDLVSALKSLRDSSDKSDAATELKKPEPFTGKDPKKLKAFIFQCQLYFRRSTAFEKDTNKVTFALSYLRDVAQDWFEPGITGQTPEPPAWLDDWEAFIGELQTNFGPYDESADYEHELSNLRMRDNQRISEYLVRFNSIAVRLPWGESTLRYRFYDGLPARIKDEIMKGDGKPRTLAGLRKKAQNIDARYWERQQEKTREQHQSQRGQQSQQSKGSQDKGSSSSGTTPSAAPKTPAKNTDQKTPKKEKSNTPKVDLTGKLDSRGKLTQQERQNRIDKNLCLYCGKSGHRSPDCPVKASSAKGRASTASTESTPAKPQASGSEKKKD